MDDKESAHQIKETTGIIKLLPIEEEKRRRNLPRPGQRGVPMLDMARIQNQQNTHHDPAARIQKEQDDS